MKTDMDHKKDMTSKQEQDIVVLMNKNKILEILKKLNGWQNNQKEIENLVKLKKKENTALKMSQQMISENLKGCQVRKVYRLERKYSKKLVL